MTCGAGPCLVAPDDLQRTSGARTAVRLAVKIRAVARASDRRGNGPVRRCPQPRHPDDSVEARSAAFANTP